MHTTKSAYLYEIRGTGRGTPENIPPAHYMCGKTFVLQECIIRRRRTSGGRLLKIVLFDKFRLGGFHQNIFISQGFITP